MFVPSIPCAQIPQFPPNGQAAWDRKTGLAALACAGALEWGCSIQVLILRPGALRNGSRFLAGCTSCSPYSAPRRGLPVAWLRYLAKDAGGARLRSKIRLRS